MKEKYFTNIKGKDLTLIKVFEDYDSAYKALVSKDQWIIRIPTHYVVIYEKKIMRVVINSEDEVQDFISNFSYFWSQVQHLAESLS